MLDILSQNITDDMAWYMLIGGIIRIIIWIFFALTLYRTLKLVKKENLCILPSQAWFVAVPLFNIYWNFEVAKRLADSLNNEFYDRKVEVEERPTQKWGLIFAWTFLLSNIPLPLFVLTIIGILHLVYFITYWVKVHEYKTLLRMHVDHYGKDFTAENKDETEM
ncbi:hypothetical protein [Sphingobacterium haloxyli]|uniref:DUF4328 domain-containing protein n=1 Tax=Sphingobacterium haloxyli TaxID=2100533 RepID=A0A2S9J7F6_9SPHI|nr:hypothetical protein [Sphingobacterium haloxyli]PRD48728.1 hypothetical protein C5745_01950 [Sphingobacterium haloxyli]